MAVACSGVADGIETVARLAGAAVALGQATCMEEKEKERDKQFYPQTILD
jgi:hypothetical protein